MPKFESFQNIVQQEKSTQEQEKEKRQAKNEQPIEVVAPATESKEAEKSVYQEIDKLWESSVDKRHPESNYAGGWYSDYAQRETELVETGVMSELEKAKLDEEMIDPSIRFQYRDFRDMVPLMKKSWELGREADKKVRMAKEIVPLVEDGDITREEYLEVLKLSANDPGAAEAKKMELFKAKCEQLSALVETPDFTNFQNRLNDKERVRYEDRFASAFNLYRSGEYLKAMRSLKELLDSNGLIPWNFGCPLNKLLKMKEAGLIGQKEMDGTLTTQENAMRNTWDNEELKWKSGVYTELQSLRGRGVIDNDQFAAYVERMKKEQIPEI